MKRAIWALLGVGVIATCGAKNASLPPAVPTAQNSNALAPNSPIRADATPTPFPRPPHTTCPTGFHYKMGWCYPKGWVPTPTPSPTPVPTPTPTVLWQAGTAGLDGFQVATGYQCGSPSAATSSMVFSLTYKPDHSCARDMLNSADQSGSLILFQEGKTYQFSFTYVDGAPGAPGMGYDTDARSLLWQLHGLNDPSTPCTSLNFWNGGTIGAAQTWALNNCVDSVATNGTPLWTGTYTPQETDTFVIQVLVSSTSAGHIDLWRNGVKQTLLNNGNGANYNAGFLPWLGWGIYNWRWESGATGMPQKQATINGATVTICPC